MNNRGFTLIELVTTIALLSIIVVISFVSINAVIEQGRKNDCHSLVSSIKAAASEYVSDNRYKRSFISGVSGNSITITADVLTNYKYLSTPIYNPFTKEEMAPSTIKIELILDSDYTVASSNIVEPNVLITCEVETKE